MDQRPLGPQDRGTRGRMRRVTQTKHLRTSWSHGWFLYCSTVLCSLEFKTGFERALALRDYIIYWSSLVHLLNWIEASSTKFNVEAEARTYCSAFLICKTQNQSAIGDQSRPPILDEVPFAASQPRDCTGSFVADCYDRWQRFNSQRL